MDQLEFQSNVSQAVAVVDLFLAVSVFLVSSFQFAHGTSLITASIKDSEKLISLIIYSSLIYSFLIVQVGMGIKLFRCARDMLDQPIDAIRVFGWWREWSVIFFLTLMLHTFVVALLMKSSQTKIICLITLLAQAVFRPLGIFVIGKFKQNLEFELPTKI